VDEFRITVTTSRGYTYADAQRLLERALEDCPEYGPTTGIEVEAGGLWLTVVLEAESSRAAIERGERLAENLFDATRIERREVVAVQCELAGPGA
jgi:hypothetical protein